MSAVKNMRDQLSNGFLGNLSAYAIAEGLAKVTRLVTVIALARSIGPEGIGLAALALTIGEIVRALTENGIGQRIIATPDKTLQKATNTAYLIFWSWAVVLVVIQVSIGLIMWKMGHPGLLAIMLAVLSLPYLIMPAGLVHCYLAMRNDRLKATAAVAATQNVTSNLLTALFIVIWPTPLSVALPKFVTAPLWMLMMRRLVQWKFDRSQGFLPLSYFIKFSASVIGVEMLRVLRLQADKLIISIFLGVEALGIYYFAFNAGLGITNSVSTAFSTCVFPHLCGKEQGVIRRQAFFKALGIVLLLLIPVVAFQVLGAQYYVPLIFGDKWAGVSDIVAMLCLAALPMVIWSGTGQWLRAHDRAHQELTLSIIITVTLLITTVVLAPYGLMAIATGYVICTTLVQLSASAWALRDTISLRRTYDALSAKYQSLSCHSQKEHEA